jgi:hypothetical protein
MFSKVIRARPDQNSVTQPMKAITKTGSPAALAWLERASGREIN